jgi:Mg2+ and Co2+ transporter CorA
MKNQPARQMAPPWRGIWHDVRVTGFLIEKDGSTAGADRETVQRLLDKGELLWLDLYRPDADELGMLAEVFGIHHLAIDDAAKFGQRPKLEDYDDFTQLVAYGVQDGTDDLGPFLVLGLGTELAIVAGMLLVFRRRGWL